MKRVIIDQWNTGGISDSIFMGPPNSLAAMVGMDVHSKPGLINANYQLRKGSGTTVDSFIKTMINCSDGSNYGFSSTTGKVWKITNAGVATLVYTTVPTAGNAGCLGAMEYNGYIYWATSKYLHRIASADTADWATNASPNWAVFTQIDTNNHRMAVVNNVLYITDKNYIAQVDGDTFTADALDLPVEQWAISVNKVLSDLVIGTQVKTSVVNKATVYRWNTWSESWSAEDEIDENAVRAFLKADNYILVSAGINGNLYSYNGTQLQGFKTIPGDYTKTAYTIIWPEATGNYKGIPLFGYSLHPSATTSPSLLGIYGFGRKRLDYPIILDLPFPIYPVSNTVMELDDIEIGAIVTDGNVILASWDNNGTYGVSALSYSYRNTGAYIDTRVINLERERLQRVKKVIVNYQSFAG